MTTADSFCSFPRESEDLVNHSVKHSVKFFKGVFSVKFKSLQWVKG